MADANQDEFARDKGDGDGGAEGPVAVLEYHGAEAEVHRHHHHGGYDGQNPDRMPAWSKGTAHSIDPSITCQAGVSP